MLIKMQNTQTSEIVIYQDSDGKGVVDVTLADETLWLSLDQISSLFERDKSVISRHLRNIFTEEELEKKAVVAFFATTAADGKRYNVEYFNLDAIISVGYRVNSKRGTHFRKWASSMLKDHIVKGANYQTRGEAKTSITSYIKYYYNRKRRHSAINY